MIQEDLSPHVRDQAVVFDCGQQLGEGWAPPGFTALDTQDEKGGEADRKRDGKTT